MSNTLVLKYKKCYNCGSTMEQLPENQEDIQPDRKYVVFIDGDGDTWCDKCRVSSSFESHWTGTYTWDNPVDPKNPARHDGQYYKFVNRDTDTGRIYSDYGTQNWTIGQKETLTGIPVLCAFGFHASGHMFDAHNHVSSDWLMLVELTGTYSETDTKICALECKPTVLYHLTNDWCKEVIQKLGDNLPVEMSDYDKEKITSYVPDDVQVNIFTLRNIYNGLPVQKEEWFDGILYEHLSTLTPFDVNSPVEVKHRIKRQLADIQETIDYVQNEMRYYSLQLSEQEKTLVQALKRFQAIKDELVKL